MSKARVIMDPAPVFFMKVSRKGSELDRNVHSRARKVAALAIQLAPQGKTGALKRSIKVEKTRVDKRPGVFAYQVVADAPYAIYVHEGTRPHIITPNTARVLRFETGGKIVFAKVVHHPGTRAQPFLRRALTAAAG